MTDIKKMAIEFFEAGAEAYKKSLLEVGVNKSSCYVIGFEDGENPEIIVNGTDEDLSKGAKLFTELEPALARIEELELELRKSQKEIEVLKIQRRAGYRPDFTYEEEYLDFLKNLDEEIELKKASVR